MTTLQLSCTMDEQEAAPGEKFQIQCDANNANDSATVITSVDVAVGTSRAKTATGSVWPEIPPNGRLPFSLTPTLPPNVLRGSTVPVTLTVKARGSAPVQQTIQVPVR